MMPVTEKNTLDKITSWASDRYGSAAPSLLNSASAPAGAQTMTATAAPAATGLLGAATQPATTTAAPAAPAKAAAPDKVDVASWYRSTLGRDGDAAGISYWQGAIDKGMDANEAYKMFQQSATTNQEKVKQPSSWAAANNYSGPTSSDGSTVVDDWYRNTMGRDATVAEKKQWGERWAGATTPEASQAVYADFLATNRDNMRNPLDLAGASQMSGQRAIAANPYTIDKSELSRRVIDPGTETVRGQLSSLLDDDSPVLQQARAEGMRTAFDRGLGNSSIAASAGADALIRAATGIATTDSGYYNKASDYNVAADNQLLMWNAEQQNEFRRLEQQLGSEEAARVMQLRIAQMGNDTTRAGQAQQMTIAQMQDATTRWNAEQAAGRDVSSQKMSLANNIIANMEMSPDRKAAMLEQLGFGTSAKRDADGNIVPGTGLAGAVYVLDSIGDELGGKYSKFPFGLGSH